MVGGFCGLQRFFIHTFSCREIKMQHQAFGYIKWKARKCGRAQLEISAYGNAVGG